MPAGSAAPGTEPSYLLWAVSAQTQTARYTTTSVPSQPRFLSCSRSASTTPIPVIYLQPSQYMTDVQEGSKLAKYIQMYTTGPYTTRFKSPTNVLLHLRCLQEYSKLACCKTHPCGHPCGGVKNEEACLPCLHGCDKSMGCLKQDADDMCMICFTEAVSAAPAVQVGALTLAGRMVVRLVDCRTENSSSFIHVLTVVDRWLIRIRIRIRIGFYSP